MPAHAIVTEFWRLMATNDFYAVTPLLTEDFLLEWPQTNELIRGGKNFAALNTAYPAAGPWRFTVNRLIATATEAVTDTTVTDGHQTARALTFFTTTGAKISKITEFWPDPATPPFNRTTWTEPLR